MLAKAIVVFVLTLHIVFCNLALAEELNVDLNLSCDLSNWTSSGQFTSFDSKPYRLANQRLLQVVVIIKGKSSPKIMLR